MLGKNLKIYYGKKETGCKVTATTQKINETETKNILKKGILKKIAEVFKRKRFNFKKDKTSASPIPHKKLMDQEESVQRRIFSDLSAENKKEVEIKEIRVDIISEKDKLDNGVSSMETEQAVEKQEIHSNFEILEEFGKFDKDDYSTETEQALEEQEFHSNIKTLEKFEFSKCLLNLPDNLNSKEEYSIALLTSKPIEEIEDTVNYCESSQPKIEMIQEEINFVNGHFLPEFSKGGVKSITENQKVTEILSGRTFFPEKEVAVSTKINTSEKEFLKIKTRDADVQVEIGRNNEDQKEDLKTVLQQFSSAYSEKPGRVKRIRCDHCAGDS